MATLSGAMRRGSGETGVVWRGVLVLASAVLLSACRDPDTLSGTALYVTTEFDPSLLLTQVRVAGGVEGGATFGPDVRPEQPERLLQSGETLRVLLEDAPNGAQATVRVEGLNSTGRVARGEATAQIRDGREVDVTVHLEPVPPDEGDGGTGTPDGGTFCADCTGCCMQGICTTSSFNTCGTGGIACVTCDPARANACDARGVCVCGANPACSGPGVDRCVGGTCKCGTGPACGAGQACVGGTCRCTSSSCSGCCSGNTCMPGNQRDQCGKDGTACLKCTKICNADGTCN